MKFTLSWLKDHLDTSSSLDKICQKLVDLGLEVESVDDPSNKFKGFVVGQILSYKKHPHADRLHVCDVDVGEGESRQVVCGAPNLYEGMKTVFADIGAVIPLTGTPLKKGKIREIESKGMLCSSSELLMGDDQEGIMELTIESPPGTRISDALGVNDPVIEISVTPNRADCFGVRGIARDLAAAGLGILKPLPYKKEITGQFSPPLQVTFQGNNACFDFKGVYIRGVKNGSSPKWVQKRLKAIGISPINALVDVTNYLTYDLCRPLHVFDASQIQGNLSLRLSKEGDVFKALNGKEYSLDSTMTVLTDDSKILALGGIMGGVTSQCYEGTQNVFLECALFDPILISKTARSLGIITDARLRFERGIDAESQGYGLALATQLILDWCGGECSHVIHARPSSSFSPPKTPLFLTHKKLVQLTGCNIPLTQAAEILEKLEFQVIQHSKALEVSVPSHRLDIQTPTDLIEEILRLYGYDAIPECPLDPLPQPSRPLTIEEIVRHQLVVRGFNEVVTWSFMMEKKAALFGGTTEMALLNPISHDLNMMRPTALPNHMDIAIRNGNRGIENIKIFEIGPTYTKDHQFLVATGLRSHQIHGRHWLETPRVVDFYDVKADVQGILLSLGIKISTCQMTFEQAPAYYHPGRKGCFKRGNQILAFFGEIHPQILQTFDISFPVVAFEVFLDSIPPKKDKKKIPLTLSPYQTITRDFAFVVGENVKAEQMSHVIKKVDQTLIKDVVVFDVYRDEKIGKHMKSIALEVRIEPQQSTLTEADIYTLTTKIVSAIQKETGATLRSPE